MSDDNNTQAALDAGEKLAEITRRITESDHEGLNLPIAIERDSDGGEKIVVLHDVIKTSDARASAPRRLVGMARFSELASFIAHVSRFKDEGSAVFADVDHCTVTAVYDYHHGADDARWCGHRAVYACPLSKPWQLWTRNDGAKMPQDTFAQFIEDNLPDLASPVGNGEDKDLPMPAEMLTMARNLVIRSKGEFSRSLNPVTGESSLVCKNENEATSTKIPRAFLLGIPVFEAGAMYRVEARMRMDMSSGRPLFSYSLYQPEVIKRDAFGEVRAKVIEQTSLPLFAGSPEQ